MSFPNGKINVCQLIQTIQGEGKYVGFPVILIRVCGCNLNCPFCDTKKLMYSSNYKSFTPEELAEVVNHVMNTTGIHHLLITGGEPLLYKADLLDFINECKKNVNVIEIETNGTLLSDHFVAYLLEMLKYFRPKVLFNISPKSNDFEKYVFGSRGYFIEYCYKLVVDTDKLDEERERVLKAKKAFTDDTLYLMPMTEQNESIETLQKKLKKLEKFCREVNVPLIPRLHLILYDTENESGESYL